MTNRRQVLAWLEEGTLTWEDAARMLRVLSPVPTPAVVENPWGSPMNKGGRFHE